MAKSTIYRKTLKKIISVLEAKGLEPEKVPAKWLEGNGAHQPKHLADMFEHEAQNLLAWLDQIPDDQPASAPAENESQNATTNPAE